MDPQHHRGWIFTLNNPTQEDCELLVDLHLSHACAFMAFGLEHAPTSGTTHLQGFCYLPKMWSLKYIKRFVEKAHFERMRGSAEENRKYCSKEGSYVEFGDVPRSGARTDILSFVREIESSASVDALIRRNPEMYLKFGSKAERVFQAFQKKKRSFLYVKPIVRVFWGETGAGKTRRAREWAMERKLDFWQKSSLMGQWFDDYEGEEVVIFDDFRGRHFHYSDLLQLMDGYGLNVPQKGKGLS